MAALVAAIILIPLSITGAAMTARPRPHDDPPLARIWYDWDVDGAGTYDIYCTANSSRDDHGIVSVHWSRPDTGQNATYDNTSAPFVIHLHRGHLVAVTLTVTDTRGQTDTAYQWIGFW